MVFGSYRVLCLGGVPTSRRIDRYRRLVNQLGDDEWRAVARVSTRSHGGLVVLRRARSGRA